MKEDGWTGRSHAFGRQGGAAARRHTRVCREHAGGSGLHPLPREQVHGLEVCVAHQYRHACQGHASGRKRPVLVLVSVLSWSSLVLVIGHPGRTPVRTAHWIVVERRMDPKGVESLLTLPVGQDLERHCPLANADCIKLISHARSPCSLRGRVPAHASPATVCYALLSCTRTAGPRSKMNVFVRNLEARFIPRCRRATATFLEGVRPLTLNRQGGENIHGQHGVLENARHRAQGL